MGSRAVDMSPRLVEILTQYRRVHGGGPDDLLFAGKNPEKPLSRQSLAQRHFHRTLKAAGVREVNFHTLRHSYAALIIACNANIKYLQHQMGHSSIQVTMDQHGHLLPDAGVGIGRRMDDLIWVSTEARSAMEG